MKKANAFAVAAVAAVVALTGCQSINTSDAGGLTINPKTVCPVDAYRPTYKVDSATPVTGNAKIHSLFGIFTWGGAGTADYADFASSPPRRPRAPRPPSTTPASPTTAMPSSPPATP